jgi:hypothetical protein
VGYTDYTVNLITEKNLFITCWICIPGIWLGVMKSQKGIWHGDKGDMYDPPGLEDALNFSLADALYGRRARRFFLGASIPDGPLAFTSRHQPFPLNELEEIMILTAAAGNTGWHNMITRHDRYAPHLSNYSTAAGGRTFPSAAGFHTSEIFFTNDNGVYFFETRDAQSLIDHAPDDFYEIAGAHRSRIRKLAHKRLHIPAAEPYMSGHNTWCVNGPGGLLIIPVADVAQHLIALLCFALQNGYCIYDDVHGERIEGLERFPHLIDTDKDPFPLTYVEQMALTECSAELSTSCYAGMLMIQAMGLGGWMFDGINRHAVLGASGEPTVPGLGFRYDTDKRWSIPNPTGLTGVFEGYCPPHYPDMRAAVEALAERKFGHGGPFNPDTPGPWKDSAKVRRSAQIHSEEFKECIALMCQYIYNRFGKFPGTVPTIFILTYLQAHHLDLEFYDHYFKAGAYLQTHAQHMARWHPDKEK